jgi:hypothetical protein
MALNRDNFTIKTVDILGKRVGYLCSNPVCRKHTVGPNTAKDKFTLLGVAAHITAASPNGPRYNAALSVEERKDIDNGIWLCSNCATLIDKDPDAFPLELLNQWKSTAEAEMNVNLLGIKVQDNEIPFLEADLIWANSQRWRKGLSVKNKELYGEYIVLGENKPIIIWELVYNFHFAIYNNSKHPAFNVKVEQIGGNGLTSLDELPKVNNLPPYADLKLNAKFERYMEGTSDEANALIETRVPEIVQGLKIKITYNDENGKEHATIFTINGEEINNERA